MEGPANGQRGTPSTTLIGRDALLAHLDSYLDELVAGRGSGLLMRGEAGIGKTALLTELAVRARGRGVQVLSAAGIEAETDLAFAGLHDLLGPLVDDVDRLPGTQAAALASALALRAPQPGERLAVAVATLGLIQHGSARQPLLAIIDDLPWLDSASREAVLFAARRASGRVAVAASARDTAVPTPLPGIRHLDVGALARVDALRLLIEVAPDLAPPVADAVADTAVGNPLALLEVVAALEPEHRTGKVGLPVPLTPGPRLQDAYAARIAALPIDTRLALLVAATYEGDQLRVVAAACSDAGVDVAALAAAERGGLVRVGDGRVAFAHPLVRGAVYHGCDADDRRTAHTALASVLRGEARAWHLGAATLAPDEGVAEELESAGRTALTRRAPGPASLALERAARLSPDTDAFARRLLAAGEAATAAALPQRALALLEEAAAAARDAGVRAAAHHERALNLYRTGMTLHSIELLAAEAAQIEPHDPVRAARMLADASMASAAAGQCHRSLAFAERSVELLGDERDTATRATVLASLGWALLMRGQVDRARPVVAEAERLAATIDPLSDSGQSVTQSLGWPTWSGDFERVYERSQRTCVRARETGALSALPLNLCFVAECSYRLGDWDTAEAAVKEAVVVGEETSQPVWVGHATVIGARLAGARGDAERALGTMQVILALSEQTGARSGVAFTHATAGFIHLGLGHADEAIRHLEEVVRFTADSGMEEPTTIPWEADLVEAYLHAGRIDDAHRVLHDMGRRARGIGTPTALAPYARCRGMVGDDFDQDFREALRLDDTRPMPFERARTQLAWGRRLHRARRRAEARSVLHDAVAGFQQLRAMPWLDHAEAELRAAGGRRRSTSTPIDELTPREERVAAAVASGLSNREAAAELFLSPKTIEFHLGQIYRKLRIRSRTQLAAALRERGGPSADGVDPEGAHSSGR